MCVCVCVCVEIKNGKESDSIEKIEKETNPKVMNLLEGKLTLKCFNFTEPSSGLLDGETCIYRTMMNV